jgi:UDP-glucose 4-epimerase
VDAIITLMDTPEAEGQVFNVGGKEEISMNELAQKVKELTGSDSEINHIPYEEVYGKGFEDMRRRTPDLTKIKEAIGYEPTHTTEDILNNVINYFKRESLLA